MQLLPTGGLVFTHSRHCRQGRARCRSGVRSHVIELALAQTLLPSQVLRTNQFSVTRHEKVANGLMGDQGLPGVFVLYELSPMMVKLTEKHR